MRIPGGGGDVGGRDDGWVDRSVGKVSVNVPVGSVRPTTRVHGLSGVGCFVYYRDGSLTKTRLPVPSGPCSFVISLFSVLIHGPYYSRYFFYFVHPVPIFIDSSTTNT